MGAQEVSELSFLSAQITEHIYVCLISASLNRRAHFTHRGAPLGSSLWGSAPQSFWTCGPVACPSLPSLITPRAGTPGHAGGPHPVGRHLQHCEKGEPGGWAIVSMLISHIPVGDCDL